MADNHANKALVDLAAGLKALAEKIGDNRTYTSRHGDPDPSGSTFNLNWVQTAALETSQRLTVLLQSNLDLSELEEWATQNVLPTINKLNSHSSYLENPWALEYLWPLLGPVFNDLKLRTSLLESQTSTPEIYLERASAAAAVLVKLEKRLHDANIALKKIEPELENVRDKFTLIENAESKLSTLSKSAKECFDEIQTAHEKGLNAEEEIGHVRDVISKHNEQISILAQEIEKRHQQASEDSRNIHQRAAESVEKLGLVNATLTNTTALFESVQAEKPNFDTNVAAVKAAADQTAPLRAQVHQDHAEVEKYKGLSETALNTMRAHLSDGDKLRAQLDDLLGRAAEAALGSAFRTRSESLRLSIIGWSVALFVSLVSMICLSKYTLIPALGTELPKDIVGVGTRLSTSIMVLGPAIWLAWISTARITQLSKLREDYAFKFASAMALESYREYAKEVNEELEAALMAAAITRFAESPLRLVKQEEPSSPYSEVANKIIDWVNAIVKPKPDTKPVPAPESQ